jgi:hypothetical protein
VVWRFVTLATFHSQQVYPPQHIQPHHSPSIPAQRAFPHREITGVHRSCLAILEIPEDQGTILRCRDCDVPLWCDLYIPDDATMAAKHLQLATAIESHTRTVRPIAADATRCPASVITAAVMGEL